MTNISEDAEYGYSIIKHEDVQFKHIAITIIGFQCLLFAILVYLAFDYKERYKIIDALILMGVLSPFMWIILNIFHVWINISRYSQAIQGNVNTANSKCVAEWGRNHRSLVKSHIIKGILFPVVFIILWVFVIFVRITYFQIINV